MGNLGWEKLIALRIIRDTPDKEASVIVKEADCSFEELYAMGFMELINIGAERLKPRECHPVITNKGLAVVNQAESDKII